MNHPTRCELIIEFASQRGAKQTFRGWRYPGNRRPRWGTTAAAELPGDPADHRHKSTKPALSREEQQPPETSHLEPICSILAISLSTRNSMKPVGVEIFRGVPILATFREVVLEVFTTPGSGQ
jgi:hypothetical protein